MMENARWAAVMALLAGCGARTELAGALPDTPATSEASASTDATDAAREPQCNLECYAAHQCCVGGCGGPAVPGVWTCCACAAGQVSSFTCAHGCAR